METIYYKKLKMIGTNNKIFNLQKIVSLHPEGQRDLIPKEVEELVLLTKKKMLIKILEKRTFTNT